MNVYKEAVIAFCMQCKEDDPFAVGACAQVECPLHSVRPNRSLTVNREELMEDSEQLVLDQLAFGGLKTLIEKRS